MNDENSWCNVILRTKAEKIFLNCSSLWFHHVTKKLQDFVAAAAVAHRISLFFGWWWRWFQKLLASCPCKQTRERREEVWEESDIGICFTIHLIHFTVLSRLYLVFITCGPGNVQEEMILFLLYAWDSFYFLHFLLVVADQVLCLHDITLKQHTAYIILIEPTWGIGFFLGWLTQLHLLPVSHHFHYPQQHPIGVFFISLALPVLYSHLSKNKHCVFIISLELRCGSPSPSFSCPKFFVRKVKVYLRGRRGTLWYVREQTNVSYRKTNINSILWTAG